jgi:hypothetical protein
VPKRTNLFQEVVEILHRHMAVDATVEASALLTSRGTGTLREVDVVIRAKQAGHEVIVSVEAMARSRKADRKWVDEMVGKHADLPTSKLVLVSEKGFTKDARARELIARTHSSFLDGPHQHDPAWAWWLTEAEITWHHAMIDADAGRWSRAAERFTVASRQPGVYAWAASIYQASLLWALAHARAWDEAETVLVRDVLPHRGEVASVRVQRTLARAGQLLDSARTRPSLREAARQLTTGP